MFNNTSSVLPFFSEQKLGVILPLSEKVLSSDDIDKKIEKVKLHIEHLFAQLPDHGGKRSRIVHRSIRDQISLSSDKIELLQKAKAAIPLNTITSTPTPISENTGSVIAGMKIKFIDYYAQP